MGYWGTGVLEVHTHRAREAPAEGEGLLGPEHRAHVVCGTVCVPRFLHDELVGAIGRPDADAWLRQHYADDMIAVGRGTLTVDRPPVAWWRHRCFDVWRGKRRQAGPVPSTRAPTRGGSSCPHEPPCETVTACIQRTLREGRAGLPQPMSA